MDIELSAAEKYKISGNIVRAIRSSFPGANDSKKLHKEWPSPKPPQAVLYALMARPADTILASRNNDLFLTLPGIVNREPLDLYGAKLFAKYEIEAERLRRETRPAPAAAPVPPPPPPPEPPAPPPSDDKRKRTDWSTIRLADSKVLQESAPELVAALAAINIHTKKDLVIKLTEDGKHQASMGRVVDALLAGDVIDLIRTKDIKVKEAMAKIAKLASLTSEQAYAKFIEAETERRAALPPKEPKVQKPPKEPKAPAKENLEPKSKRTDWSTIRLADSKALQESAPELIAAFAALNIHTKNELVQRLDPAGANRKGTGQIVDALMSGEIINLQSKKEIRVKETMTRVAGIADIPVEKAFAKFIEAETERRAALPPKEVKAKPPKEPKAKKPPKEKKAKPPKEPKAPKPPKEKKVKVPTVKVHKWAEIRLADSKALQESAPELIAALAERNIHTKHDLATELAKDGRKLNSVGPVVDALMAGEIINLHNKQEVLVKETMKRVANIAGLPAERAYAKFIEAETERRAALAPKPGKSKKPRSPKAGFGEAADEAGAEAKAKKLHWSEIRLANSTFLQESAPELITQLAALDIHTKRDLVDKLIEKNPKLHSSAAGKAVDALMSGEVIQKSRSEIIIRENVQPIAEIVGVPVDKIFAKAIEQERIRRETAPAPVPDPAKGKGNKPSSSPIMGGSAAINASGQDSFDMLGLDARDVRGLRDMGVNKYDQLIKLFGKSGDSPIGGMFTPQATIRDAVKLAAGMMNGRGHEGNGAAPPAPPPSGDHPPKGKGDASKGNGDAEHQFIPLRPDERVLGADSSIGKWRHSGLDADQIESLREEKIRTVGDVAGLAYEDLTDALGEDVKPAFATDLILRAKVISKEMSAAEYPDQRVRWLQFLNSAPRA